MKFKKILPSISFLLASSITISAQAPGHGQASKSRLMANASAPLSTPQDDKRMQVIASLNNLLADQYVLYTKTYNYHWNIEGDMFNDLHDLFQKQFEALIVVVDDLAERVRALQGVALGTLNEFLSRTRLKEEPGVVPSQFEMVARLLADYEMIIEAMKHVADRCNDELSDRGTGQFLYDIVKQQEKTAWMLRSLLAKK